MTAMPFFTLEAWSAWTPLCQSQQDWQTWGDHPKTEHIGEKPEPDVCDIPMMLRRRLPPLARMAFRAALDVDDKRENMHLVFASRHGDAGITPVILDDIAKDQPVSPAKFSTSVHNALAGMYSIHTNNTAPHTLISAGDASFIHGLLEAQAILHEDCNRSVLLVYYDVPLPKFFGNFCDDGTTSVAIALLMSNADDASYQKMALTPDDYANQPLSVDPVLDFIRFILGRDPEWRSHIGQTNWVCKRHV